MSGTLRPGTSNTPTGSTDLSFWEQYRALFNKRGHNWCATEFAYPLARLLVLPIVSVRWITPNRLTVASLVCKCVGAWLLLSNDRSDLIAAVLLLQGQIIFDCMDGTLARVRESYSLFGAFFDKVTDAIGLFVVCIAVGWRATEHSGNPIWLVVACSGGAAYITLCYMHWVVEAIAKPRANATETANMAPIPSWPEIGKEWLRAWIKMPLFQEADLYLWVTVFAVLGQFEVLAIILGASQVLGLMIRIFTHSQTLRRADTLNVT